MPDAAAAGPVVELLDHHGAGGGSITLPQLAAVPEDERVAESAQALTQMRLLAAGEEVLEEHCPFRRSIAPPQLDPLRMVASWGEGEKQHPVNGGEIPKARVIRRVRCDGHEQSRPRGRSVALPELVSGL